MVDNWVDFYFFLKSHSYVFGVYNLKPSDKVLRLTTQEKHKKEQCILAWAEKYKKQKLAVIEKIQHAHINALILNDKPNIKMGLDTWI